MILTEEYIDFIKKNVGCDTVRLRLMMAGKTLSFDVNDAIMQIEARKAASKKLPEFCSHPSALFPHKLSAEQATSEMLARFHASLLPSHTRSLLDMTAGLGIDSMAFAKTGKTVTAIEKDSHTADTLRHNADIMGIENIRVVNADSIGYLNSSDNVWDIIYVDPARRSEAGGRTYDFSDCTPDIIPSLQMIYSHCKFLMVKASPMLDVSRTIEMLPGIYDIRVVSLRGECKELLLMASENREKATECHAVNILPDGTVEDFSFSMDDEKEDHDIRMASSIDGIRGKEWLYEPNASMMKFAPWKSLSKRFPSLLKLHPNTHLFVSDTLLPDFPGRVFRIEDIGSLRSEVSKTLKGTKKCVAVRNFPLTAQSLASRLKVKNGGDSDFVFGATINPDSHCIITATRINERARR